MKTREIPRTEWQEFLDEFSKQHEGWHCTIEVLGMEVGDQVVAEEWPLQGVSVDRTGTSSAGGEAISFIAGDSVSQHVTHTVPNPASLRVAQTDDGMDQGLQVESEDGPTTLLTFRSPMSPEMYDR
jgi:hypothetical protein